MPDLLTRLRARGWNLTAQRRVVAEVLRDDHAHLTADEIHGRATAVLPEISRATVYNALRELVEMGELRELRSGAKATRYDPNMALPHQHLVCSGCGVTHDVPSPSSAGIALPPASRRGFTIDAVEIVYHGRCPACRTVPAAGGHG